MSSRLDNALNSVRDNPALAQKQLAGPSPTPALARYIASSQSASIPDDMLELGKRHILDTLASLIVSSPLKPACLARISRGPMVSSLNEATLLTTDEKDSSIR